MKKSQMIIANELIGGRLHLPLYQFAVGLLLSGWLLVFNPVFAEPYIPQSDSEVLEYLPEKIILFSAGKKIENDEARIKAYIQQAKSSGDSRYISYAQNILNKWLQTQPESGDPRLINAALLQYNHKFEQAIVELKSLLIDHPGKSEAWSLLANLQLLSGRYAAAKSSCKSLSVRSSLADTIICQSNILIRTGALDQAHMMLATLSPVFDEMSIQKKLWILISQAEIKLQQDENILAGRYLERARVLAEKNAIDDAYLWRLYIDYLVQNHRYEEAFVLVKNKKNDSALMIRATVLAKHLGEQKLFKVNTIALMQSFEVEQRRGQGRHLREQALFTLLVLNNPDEALRLARLNWAMQKEVEDARILMKSALYATDVSQLKIVQQAIKNTGLVDRRLQIARLQESLL